MAEGFRDFSLWFLDPVALAQEEPVPFMAADRQRELEEISGL